MRRIAVTGGIAEGKSTVLSYIADAGVPTVSTDELSREVWKTPEVQSAVAASLGVEPPVRREVALQALAVDSDIRRQINRITHARILDRMLRRSEPVVEVPLLIEACLQPLFDRVWVVTCGPEEQFRRLVERLGAEESASRLIASQLPSEAKCAFADRVVRTNLDKRRVHAYVSEAIFLDIG